MQAVPHQLPCGESGEPAIQRGGRARRAEGCLLAVVQRLSLPGAKRTKITKGMLFFSYFSLSHCFRLIVSLIVLMHAFKKKNAEFNFVNLLLKY